MVKIKYDYLTVCPKCKARVPTTIEVGSLRCKCGQVIKRKFKGKILNIHDILRKKKVINK